MNKDELKDDDIEESIFNVLNFNDNNVDYFEDNIIVNDQNKYYRYNFEYDEKL